MNKKELIKLLDKCEIEYEITDNAKEVEEGLRLFDEALEKIGIVIPKEARVNTVTTEWASSSDLISRQGIIRAMCQECVHGGYDECSVDCVVAEILRELPPVEDAISRADTIKALCQECEMKCVCNHDCTEVAVIRGIPSVSGKEVDYCNNDCINRQDAIEAIEGVDWYHVNSKGELVHGSTSDEESWYRAKDVYKAIESLPPIEPPKKVVAQIKADTEEIVERIKEEYEIKERPECEDTISRQAAIEEIKNATTITGWNKYASQEEIVDDVERQLRRLFVGAIESLPPVEPKPVCENTISRQAAINAIENINAIARPISESDDVLCQKDMRGDKE